MLATDVALPRPMNPGAGQAPRRAHRSRVLRGGCLCGAIEYRLTSDLKYAGYCHCEDCQRGSGSIFAAFGGVSRSQFTVKRGAKRIRRYVKDADNIICFCATCGSRLFVIRPNEDMVHIGLGSLRDRQALTPQFHAFVRDKALWYQIIDALPQFYHGPQILACERG